MTVIDQSGKKRLSETDALGGLTKMTEDPRSIVERYYDGATSAEQALALVHEDWLGMSRHSYADRAS